MAGPTMTSIVGAVEWCGNIQTFRAMAKNKPAGMAMSIRLASEIGCLPLSTVDPALMTGPISGGGGGQRPSPTAAPRNDLARLGRLPGGHGNAGPGGLCRRARSPCPASSPLLPAGRVVVARGGVGTGTRAEGSGSGAAGAVAV